MAFSTLAIISTFWQILMCVVSTPVQRLCPVGQYLDVVTGACDPCGHICHMADVQETAHLCQIHCPEYHATSNVKVKDETRTKQELCPPGTYLDEVTLRCDSCVALCTKDDKNECKKKCPGHLDQAIPSFPRKQLNVILWILVTVLSITFVVIVVFIIIKYTSIRSTRSVERRLRELGKSGPIIVPYIKVGEEKPQQRVDRWLSLLHARDPSADCESCFSSSTSLIYNPVATKS